MIQKLIILSALLETKYQYQNGKPILSKIIVKFNHSISLYAKTAVLLFRLE